MIRFDEDLRAQITSNLSARDRVVVTDPSKRAAAVAITLQADPEEGAGFVLTQRTSRLRSHSNQYALPGGRMDPGETQTITARRELGEEVGIHVDHAAVLGVLDDYETRSGYVITPVVIWADRPTPWNPNAEEVERAFLVPLSELMRADSPRWLEIPESPYPVIQLPIFNRLIHAPTAAIVHQFAEVGLHGRPCRTDEIEEPVWAWR